MGWYVPPKAIECNEADFQVNGTLDAASYKKCLNNQNDINKEIQAYTDVKDACMAKWLAEEAEKAAIAAAEAAAAAEANAQPADSSSNDENNFFAESLLSDAELEAQCAIYGKIAETNYYDMGEFFGQVLA